MNPLSIRNQPITALVAACACWGIATVITKSVLASISPITLLVIQLAVSVTSLWGLVLIRRTQRPAPTPWLRHLLLGWLNPGIAYTLSLLGLAATTVSMSTLLWATEPILILSLAWLVLRERLAPSLLLWCATAALGVVLVGGLGSSGAATGDLGGNALVSAGVLCCAFYTVLARRSGLEADTVRSLAVQQTAALAWTLAIWLWEGLVTDAAPQLPPSWPVLMWAGISGLLYYALAFWLYLRALSQVRASLAGAMLNLTSVFGVAGAYFFLGERLTPAQWLGGGLILGAVLAILWRPGPVSVPADP